MYIVRLFVVIIYELGKRDFFLCQFFFFFFIVYAKKVIFPATYPRFTVSTLQSKHCKVNKERVV